MTAQEEKKPFCLKMRFNPFQQELEPMFRWEVSCHPLFLCLEHGHHSKDKTMASATLLYSILLKVSSLKDYNTCSKLWGHEGKCSLNSSSYPKQSLHSKIIAWFVVKGNRLWIWYFDSELQPDARQDRMLLATNVLRSARQQNASGARSCLLLRKNRRAVSTKSHFI